MNPSIKGIKELNLCSINAAIAITDAIRCTSFETFFQKLSLELLRSKRWLRKFCLLCEVCKNKSPSYLYNLIPDRVIVLKADKSIVFPILKLGEAFSEILFFFVNN